LGADEPYELCVRAYVRFYVGQCSSDHVDGAEQQDEHACERGGLKHVSSYVSCVSSWIYVFGELLNGYENVI